MTSTTLDLRYGQCYEVEWQARDIGYGSEGDMRPYIYLGIRSGKHAFLPVGLGNPDTLYLFEDEIEDAREVTLEWAESFYGSAKNAVELRAELRKWIATRTREDGWNDKKIVHQAAALLEALEAEIDSARSDAAAMLEP